MVSRGHLPGIAHPPRSLTANDRKMTANDENDVCDFVKVFRDGLIGFDSL